MHLFQDNAVKLCKSFNLEYLLPLRTLEKPDITRYKRSEGISTASLFI